jgi:hypothetical protein
VLSTSHTSAQVILRGENRELNFKLHRLEHRADPPERVSADQVHLKPVFEGSGTIGSAASPQSKILADQRSNFSFYNETVLYATGVEVVNETRNSDLEIRSANGHAAPIDQQGIQGSNRRFPCMLPSPCTQMNP